LTIGPEIFSVDQDLDLSISPGHEAMMIEEIRRFETVKKNLELSILDFMSEIRIRVSSL
jgi:hypothetical protein